LLAAGVVDRGVDRDASLSGDHTGVRAAVGVNPGQGPV